MTTDVLFLSEKYIKDNSFISDNVDPKQLFPTLRAVQDRYIHTMLGTALYKKLQQMVKDVQTTPLPDDYKVLLEDYVQPSLLWYTLADMPIPMQYKVVNKGVIQRSDNTVQITSTTDRKELSDYCNGYAQWYAQRAIDYLRANSGKYPEYTSPGSGCDTIHPDKSQYTTGIYLGGSYSGRKREYRDKYK